MSLATPPSQTEEHGRYDGWGDVSPTGSQRRKMSFNPIGEWVPPVAHEEPVGAFEVSKGKRVCECPSIHLSETIRTLMDNGRQYKSLLP